MKRQYTEEFKKQAVKLAVELGNITEAARQLGTNDGVIHAWMKKYNVVASGKDKRVEFSESEEIRRLKKENEELKKINHILKRAAAFFSQDHLK